MYAGGEGCNHMSIWLLHEGRTLGSHRPPVLPHASASCLKADAASDGCWQSWMLPWHARSLSDVPAAAVGPAALRRLRTALHCRRCVTSCCRVRRKPKLAAVPHQPGRGSSPGLAAVMLVAARPCRPTHLACWCWPLEGVRVPRLQIRRRGWLLRRRCASLFTIEHLRCHKIVRVTQRSRGATLRSAPGCQ